MRCLAWPHRSEAFLTDGDFVFKKGKDCCAGNTELSETDLQNSLDNSALASHGLLTYASRSCVGGNETLTTPCPEVSERIMMVLRAMVTGRLNLQGSCLNYNLERYSCFMENIEIDGSLVGDYVPKATRKVSCSE